MSFWAELRRRNVFKVGAAYAIVAWLLIQIASTVLPNFGAPTWVMPVFIALVILLFPLALVLSWAYEITPEGVKKTAEVPAHQSITHLTSHKLNYVVTGLLAVAVAFMAVDTYLIGDSASDNSTGTLSGEPSSASPSGGGAAADQRGRPKVAVLPCANLSTDPEDAYVADSIHIEILNQVAKLSGLRVVSGPSVARYKEARPPIPEIARDLGATAVMECNVRYAGDDILVTAVLFDPQTDSHMWTDTYPGNLSDVSTIFAMQADIAMNIANAVEAEFSQAEQARLEREPTTSAEAYDLYLRARSLMRGTSPAATQEANRLLGEAIRIDPQFALAYAARASVLTFRLLGAESSDWQQSEQLGREDAEHALRLDPEIGLAYNALAQLYRHTWRWSEAIEAFDMALALSPNDPVILADYGWLNSFRGAHDESLRMAMRRLELEPGVGGAYLSLGLTQSGMGNAQEAANALRQAVLLDPTTIPGRQHLGVVLAVLGDRSAAEAEFRTVEDLLGNNPPLLFLPELAMGYSLIGREVDARRLHDEVLAAVAQRDVGAGVLAMAYLAVGDRDNLIEQLEIAVAKAERHEPDSGFLSLMIIKNNSMRHAMLEEPQLRALRARLGTVALGDGR